MCAMKYVDHVTCIQIYNLYYDIIMFSRMHAWCIGMYKYVVYARCIIWSCTYIHAVKLKWALSKGLAKQQDATGFVNTIVMTW